MIRFDDKRNAFLSPLVENSFRVGNDRYVSVFKYYAFKKFIETDPAFAKRILTQGSVRGTVKLSMMASKKIPGSWLADRYEVLKAGYMHMFDSNRELKKQFIALKGSSFMYVSRDAPLFLTYKGDNLAGKVLGELMMLYSGTTVPTSATRRTVRSRAVVAKTAAAMNKKIEDTCWYTCREVVKQVLP
jgi:predicted NAD-dependent protein-ADP-ribosyltransferase YbiA (DUF1768 family)